MAPRQELSKVIKTLEEIEFESDADIAKYAKAMQALGTGLYLQLSMDADLIKGTLESYKGQWYEFGVGTKMRARTVAAYIRIAAEACKIIGTGGVRMHASFKKLFVAPEMAARQAKARKGKGGKAFKIDGS